MKTDQVVQLSFCSDVCYLNYFQRLSEVEYTGSNDNSRLALPTALCTDSGLGTEACYCGEKEMCVRLDCQHYVCKRCVVTYKKKEYVVCPTCEFVSLLPGVSQSQTCLYIPVCTGQ